MREQKTEARFWNDGLGGHVIRLLPVLDAGLALGLRVVCNPTIFFNGKSEDPHAFGTLVGCVGKAWPNATADIAQWMSVTEWVDEAAVSALPHVRVKLCDLAESVERSANAQPTVFEVMITGGGQEKWGSLGGPWLRRQFHAVRRERARLAAERAAGAAAPEHGASPLAVDGAALWAGAPPGHRVLVHYRTGMWSLMPMRRGVYATHFDQLSRLLDELERRKVISRRGADHQPARLVFMAALIEDEQAINRTKHEIALLFGKYPGIGLQLISEKDDSRRPETIARDLDLMTTADYFLPGTGQWAYVASMLQDDNGVHVYAAGQPAGAFMQNTRLISPKGELSQRPPPLSPFTPRSLKVLCTRSPGLRDREEQGKRPNTMPPKDWEEFKQKQIKQIRDRPYMGPPLPDERRQPPPGNMQRGPGPPKPGQQPPGTPGKPPPRAKPQPGQGAPSKRQPGKKPARKRQLHGDEL